MNYLDRLTLFTLECREMIFRNESYAGKSSRAGIRLVPAIWAIYK